RPHSFCRHRRRDSQLSGTPHEMSQCGEKPRGRFERKSIAHGQTQERATESISEFHPFLLRSQRLPITAWDIDQRFSRLFSSRIPMAQIPSILSIITEGLTASGFTSSRSFVTLL